ncbi:hypothetical protein [Myroides pelagicus]|uniref:Uncharacterized protein n=1 Tax=Myroides pelagicus TaxID=270914 RepID=A0A7K1GLF6_9FLAO|nr:hypothetical protein [Myroides pelagicus]MEC4112701.1 hypothetical protein [Myroides pelagicus]MTH29705.1 hypothetical protein [Myroides pelagicus]
MIETQKNGNKTISICALTTSMSSILVFAYSEVLPFSKIIGPILFFIGLILSIVALKQSNKSMAYLSFACLFIMLTLVTKSVFTVYSPIPSSPEQIANLK